MSFGATGDLAHKMVFPALQALVKKGRLDIPIVGVTKAGWNLQRLRERARDSLATFGGGVDAAALAKLSRRVPGRSAAAGTVTTELRRPWLLRLDAARDRAAAAFGVTREARSLCVEAMLSGHRHDGASYWLQLLVSMGIATFGLVLDSGAVVIGAMLVSPLMGPLVELGMGLAIGSAVLISRALFRTIASVVAVASGAACLTVLLPFHEVTAQIASRASPTVLDLFVAALCAVMAGYTTLKSASSSANTAAGAAIAIALVPPLAVVGWGVGTGRWEVTRGAALLFTANLCGIVALTITMFVALGFERVEVRSLEEQAAEPARWSDRVAARLRTLLGSRYGLFVRYVVPLMLVVAVFVPLRHALEEVVWQVRVRGEVQTLVDRLAPAQESVHSTIRVASHRVTVRLVILGDSARAKRIEQALRAGIAKSTDVSPTIDVVAVPDLSVLDKVAAEHRTEGPVSPQPPTFPDLDWPRRIVRDALASDWPQRAAGPLLSWDLRIEDAPEATLEVVHYGPPLGASGADLLGRDLTREVGSTVVVVDHAVSSDASDAQPAEGASWLPRVLRQAGIAGEEPRLSICVTVPRVEPRGGLAKAVTTVVDAVRESLAAVPEERRSVVEGEGWSSRLSLVPCEPVDAGSPRNDASSLPSPATLEPSPDASP